MANLKWEIGCPDDRGIKEFVQALTAEVERLTKENESLGRLNEDCYDKRAEMQGKIQALTAELGVQEQMLSQKDATIRMQTKRHKLDQTQLSENLKVCHRLANDTVSQQAQIKTLKEALEMVQAQFAHYARDHGDDDIMEAYKPSEKGR